MDPVSQAEFFSDFCGALQCTLIIFSVDIAYVPDRVAKLAEPVRGEEPAVLALRIDLVHPDTHYLQRRSSDKDQTDIFGHCDGDIFRIVRIIIPYNLNLWRQPCADLFVSFVEIDLVSVVIPEPAVAVNFIYYFAIALDFTQSANFLPAVVCSQSSRIFRPVLPIRHVFLSLRSVRHRPQGSGLPLRS